ncbi:MAG: hypothetical protein ABIH23_08430 [bacterium]
MGRRGPKPNPKSKKRQYSRQKHTPTGRLNKTGWNWRYGIRWQRNSQVVRKSAHEVVLIFLTEMLTGRANQYAKDAFLKRAIKDPTLWKKLNEIASEIGIDNLENRVWREEMAIAFDKKPASPAAKQLALDRVMNIMGAATGEYSHVAPQKVDVTARMKVPEEILGMSPEDVEQLLEMHPEELQKRIEHQVEIGKTTQKDAKEFMETVNKPLDDWLNEGEIEDAEIGEVE